jgi:16S rRNA (uracil1498-N3)-methyltransferase
MLQPDSAHTLPAGGPHAGPVVLLVGPEGGLNAEEQSLARQAGFRGIRLGQRILRTETAALAALAGIQALWGDFRKAGCDP